MAHIVLDVEHQSNDWDWYRDIMTVAVITPDGIEIHKINRGQRSSSNAWGTDGSRWEKDTFVRDATPVDVSEHQPLLCGKVGAAYCCVCGRTRTDIPLDRPYVGKHGFLTGYYRCPGSSVCAIHPVKVA